MSLPDGFSNESTVMGVVIDTLYEYRFPVYVTLVATLFIVDGLFTTPSNRAPEGIVSFLAWFLYSAFLVRAFIRLREDDISTEDQPAHLLAKMIVVVIGWWSLELFFTEVLFVYVYTIPTECTGTCYRMVPLFVPPGHWIIYDLGNMAAERFSKTRYRSFLSGAYVSTANMLSEMRRGLPISMKSGSSGIRKFRARGNDSVLEAYIQLLLSRARYLAIGSWLAAGTLNRTLACF